MLFITFYEIWLNMGHLWDVTCCSTFGSHLVPSLLFTDPVCEYSLPPPPPPSLCIHSTAFLWIYLFTFTMKLQKKKLLLLNCVLSLHIKLGYSIISSFNHTPLRITVLQMYPPFLKTIYQTAPGQASVISPLPWDRL